MERLKKMIIGVGVLFAALGIGFASVSDRSITRTEAWMEENTAQVFGNYRMLPGDDGPNVTYRMLESTYTELKPYGIVCRVMTSGQEVYDTVVIMSSKKESFHDPRVCFTAQGWALLDQKVAMVKTKAHGDVPITLTTMSGDRGKSFAAFFYRGPEGFAADTNGVKWQMLRYQMKNFRDGEGVFYRVIPTHPVATEEQLIKFIGEWLDAQHEASKGLI